MAVTLLEIARIFATKAPGKIDADVLQLLWKVCFYLLSVICYLLFFSEYLFDKAVPSSLVSLSSAENKILLNN